MQNEAANYLLDSLIFLLGTTLLFLHLAQETLDRVLHKAGDSHRTYATRYGSDGRCNGLDSSEVHITAQLLCLGIAVHTDVDYHGTLRHHVGRNELRATDGHHQDLGTASHLSEVLRAAVANGDRSVCVEQEHCHRLTHDIGATDDHALFAAHVDSALFKQYHNARRGTRKEIVISDHDLTHVIGVECVNVLFGLDLEEHLGFVEVLGERQLNENSVDLIVVIKSFNKVDCLVAADSERKRRS